MAASVRVRAPSFWQIFLTCTLAVPSVMKSVRPISLFVRPCVTS